MPKKAHNNRFEVARVLEQAILTGHLRPGSRLPEMVIARELGVSQAGVREALQELENLGLVLKYPNRGSVVTQLTSDDLVQIYQVRRELEPLACSLAAVQISPAGLTDLQTCLSGMQAAAETGSFQKFSEADVRFHRLIWSSQQNRVLERALLSACLPLFAFDLIRRYSSPHVEFSRTILQHQRIFQALKRRDPEFVSQLMRRTIERWLRQDLLDYDQIQHERLPEPLTGSENQKSSFAFLRDLSYDT